MCRPVPMGHRAFLRVRYPSFPSKTWLSSREIDRRVRCRGRSRSSPAALSARRAVRQKLSGLPPTSWAPAGASSCPAARRCGFPF
eukprot:5351647-Prymnesium_polylepis.1